MSNHQPPPTPTAAVGFTNIADFVFNIGTLLAMDLSGYQQGAEGREVVFVFVGPYEHIFQQERADAAYLWYLEISDQNRIEKPTAMTPNRFPL
jgi:hypothetical protein